MADQLPFESEIDKGDSEPSFLVDLDGFEGPLDLLLELARRQKVDIAKISILALAEQYLLFIDEARRVRLELAADYLVMAAWLAYLKSRLLVPEPPKANDEPLAADLAAALAARLRRLEAIRNPCQVAGLEHNTLLVALEALVLRGGKDDVDQRRPLEKRGEMRGRARAADLDFGAPPRQAMATRPSVLRPDGEPQNYVRPGS